MRSEERQRLTLDELRTQHARAYEAFMDFTEAQTMFWELSVGTAGDIWAEDWQMDSRVQWIPASGRWECPRTDPVAHVDIDAPPPPCPHPEHRLGTRGVLRKHQRVCLQCGKVIMISGRRK